MEIYMDKHPYDELIDTVAEKMKEHEDDNLGFGIFDKVDKDLGLSRGTAWDASGWKDYCDFGFGDVWLQIFAYIDLKTRGDKVGLSIICPTQFMKPIT